MDWDDSVNPDDLVDETLSGMPISALLAVLPDGPPGKDEGRAGQKLTEAEKIFVQRLREVAVQLAKSHQNQVYCHVFLKKGGGCGRIFRYIAVHNHKADSDYKWCRILPQHRGEKGKKYEVYKLVPLSDDITSPSCGCALCTGE